MTGFWALIIVIMLASCAALAASRWPKTPPFGWSHEAWAFTVWAVTFAICVCIAVALFRSGWYPD